MTEGDASLNEFETDKGETAARTRAESAVEDLRGRGGVFVDAVRATRMPMALTDPTLPGNPIVFANESFVKISGYSLDEILGQQPFFLNGADTDPEHAAAFHRALEEDRDISLETAQYRKDGSRFVATLFLSAFKDDEGRTLHHFLSWGDVTRRVDAEEDVATLRGARAELLESERRQAFLLELSDALRPIDDPEEVQRAAMEALGKHMGVSRALYFDVQSDLESVKRGPLYLDGVEPVPPVLRIADFGDFTAAAYRRGETIVIADVQKDARFSPKDREAFAAVHTRAGVGVPLLKGGTLVAIIGVNQAKPRAWTGADPVLLKEVAERTWAAAERARSQTALRESEERQAFLLRFSDALRAEPSADAVANRALRMLSEQMRLDRCYVGIYRLAEDLADFPYQVHGDRLPPMPAQVRLSDFPEALKIAFDRTMVIEDALTTESFSDSDRASFSALELRAVVTATLHKGERNPLWAIVAGSASARVWTQSEISLVEEVTERTWAAVERARAETALRASEEKYRSLFENMGQGYSLVENVRDESGKAVDQRYLELNPAVERFLGAKAEDAVGRLGSEVFPGLEEVWTETFDRVTRSGVPEHIEDYNSGLDRWFGVYVYPAGGDRFMTLYEDITDRKRAELALRDSEERQAFLLKLSDALRAEPDAEAIADRAVRMLFEQMGLDRCFIGTFHLEEDRAGYHHQVHHDHLPPLPAEVRISDFPEALQVLLDGSLVIDNIAVKEGFSEDERANIEALGLHALIDVTLRKGEKNPLWAIVAGSACPRVWTQGEISLVEEVAERTWAAIERARADAARRESDARYHLLFESLDSGFCVIEMIFAEDGRATDYRFVEANPAFERQSGLVDAVGRRIREFAPDLEEHWFERYGRVALTGEPLQIEGEAAPLGRWFDISAFRIGPPEQHRVAVLFTDITDRKRTEAALREAEGRYLSLFHAIDQGFCTIEVKFDDQQRAIDYRFLEISPHFEQQAGFAAAPGSGMRDIAPDHDEHWFEVYGRVALTGEPARFENFSTPLDRWWSVYAFKVEGSNTVAVLFHDITDRKRAEREIASREQQFETLLDQAPLGVYLVDNDFMIRQVNPIALPVFGDIEGGPVGQDFDEVIHVLWDKDYADEVVRIFRHTLETGEPYVTAERAEYRVDLDVTEYYEWRLDRIILPEGRHGVVCYFRDISAQVHARHEIEEQREAARASEERYRTLVTVGSSSIYRMSPDWREMRQLIGAGFIEDLSEPTTDWIGSYIPADERSRVEQEIERAIRTKDVFELEHRVQRVDGTVGWTFSRAIPLLNDAGEIAEWFGVANDVTARVKADQSFTRLFEASPAPFLVLAPDPERFTITEVNDAYLAATMRTREDLVGRALFDAFPDNPNEPAIGGVSRLRASLERVLASRQPDALPGLKYDIPRPDGTFEERWWSPVNSPILDENGEVEAIIHNANDVTEERRAEAALRESEERFRGFAENSADVLWIVDAGTMELEYLSPAFEQIWGEGRETVMQNIGRWAELVHPDDREQAAQGMPRILAGETYTGTYRIVRPDGKVRWIRDTGFPIHEEGVKRVGGIAQDITGLKAAEAAVSRSEERYRLIVENARDYAILMTDPQDIITDWLPGAEAVFGWTREEAIGAPAGIIFTPEDRAEHVPEREIETAAREGEAPDVRWHQRKDGSHVFIEGMTTPLYNEDGSIRGFLKIGQDVSERRHAQEALEASERRMRTLATGIPQLVFRSLGDGHRIWGSPQWIEYTGISFEDSVGYGWLDGVHSGDRDATVAAWEGVEERGEYYCEQRILHAATGKYRWHQTRATPLRAEDGRILEWLGTSTDVEELRGLQRHQRLLVAELQHRVRNILAMIRSVARRTAVTSQTVEEYSQHLEGRIGAMARTQAMLTRQPGKGVSLTEMIDEELRSVAAQEKQYWAEGPDVLLEPKAAEVLTLAIHELATNSIKYGSLSQAQGQLEIRWAIEAREKEQWLVFDWEESRVKGTAAPTRRGFGTELITARVPYELGGSGAFAYRRDGIRAVIEFPLRPSTSILETSPATGVDV